MATHVREAWVAAERPPLGAFATSIACAGAIMGLRGDEGWFDWFEIADELSDGALGNKAGVIVMRADIELHQGEVQCAADRFVSEISTTWFRSPYLAGRAEAFARLGLKEADDAIRAAEENIGEHRYGLGILLRAKGIRANDDASVRESLDLFKELDCPYQTARTGWLLGGMPARRRRASSSDSARPFPPDFGSRPRVAASAAPRRGAWRPASRASARRPRGAAR